MSQIKSNPGKGKKSSTSNGGGISKQDGGPAFAGTNVYCETIDEQAHAGVAISREGMSLRAYAAIELRVPDSGIDWLDKMIILAKRDEFAEMALQGLLSMYGQHATNDGSKTMVNDSVARCAWEITDVMLGLWKKDE